MTEIRIDKYAHGEVRYCDCMDTIHGLPSLTDKSFDLCLTDPPYGIEFKGKKNLVKNHKIAYNDKINMDWNKKWFNEVLKICKGIVFTCGSHFFYEWIQYKKPDYKMRYWYKSNACGFNAHLEPLMFYGRINNYSHLRDVIEVPINLSKEHKTIHISPKAFLFFYKIITKLKPLNILDPFLGSGTTAEVCEKLGIKWLGYELNEVYSQDIEKRLKNVKVEPKQVDLGGFLK